MIGDYMILMISTFKFLMLLINVLGESMMHLWDLRFREHSFQIVRFVIAMRLLSYLFWFCGGGSLYSLVVSGLGIGYLIVGGKVTGLTLSLFSFLISSNGSRKFNLIIRWLEVYNQWSYYCLNLGYRYLFTLVISK